MPSLSPDSTFSPCRMREGRRGSVTTACPSAASVGARITARISDLPQAERAEQPSAYRPARQDRQRQADTEQPRGHGVLAAKRRQVDPRGVGEEHQGQRSSARIRICSLVGPKSIQPSPSFPTIRPVERKKIGAVIRRPFEGAREPGIGEQDSCGGRERPGTHRAILRLSLTILPRSWRMSHCSSGRRAQRCRLGLHGDPGAAAGPRSDPIRPVHKDADSVSSVPDHDEMSRRCSWLCWRGAWFGLSAGLDGRDASGEQQGDEREECEDRRRRRAARRSGSARSS